MDNRETASLRSAAHSGGRSDRNSGSFEIGVEKSYLLSADVSGLLMGSVGGGESDRSGDIGFCCGDSNRGGCGDDCAMLSTIYRSVAID